MRPLAHSFVTPNMVTLGELARLSGRSSRFGHALDRVVSAASYVVAFAGMGIGMGDGRGLANDPPRR